MTLLRPWAVLAFCLSLALTLAMGAPGCASNPTPHPGQSEEGAPFAEDQRASGGGAAQGDDAPDPRAGEAPGGEVSLSADDVQASDTLDTEDVETEGDLGPAPMDGQGD